MVNEAKGRRPLLRGYWSTAVIVVLFLAAYTLATDVSGALDKILFPGPSKIGRPFCRPCRAFGIPSSAPWAS